MCFRSVPAYGCTASVLVCRACRWTVCGVPRWRGRCDWRVLVRARKATAIIGGRIYFEITTPFDMPHHWWGPSPSVLAYVGELAADDALLAPGRGVDDAARLQADGWGSRAGQRREVRGRRMILIIFALMRANRRSCQGTNVRRNTVQRVGRVTQGRVGRDLGGAGGCRGGGLGPAARRGASPGRAAGCGISCLGGLCGRVGDGHDGYSPRQRWLVLGAHLLEVATVSRQVHATEVVYGVADPDVAALPEYGVSP